MRTPIFQMPVFRICMYKERCYLLLIDPFVVPDTFMIMLVSMGMSLPVVTPVKMSCYCMFGDRGHYVTDFAYIMEKNKRVLIVAKS